MNDLAKEELSTGGQMLLLFSAGLFFAAVGFWFLVNAKKPDAVNKMRSISGFSPRGVKETQILVRILGLGFVIGGVAAIAGGSVVAFS
ncbi:hypothetical protein [Streptomyces sp. NPDC055186]